MTKGKHPTKSRFFEMDGRELMNAMAHMSADGCTFRATIELDTSNAKQDSELFASFRGIMVNGKVVVQIGSGDVKELAKMIVRGKDTPGTAHTSQAFLE